MQPHGNGHQSPQPTTAIAVVVDETGSMAGCRGAAIRGYNRWLRSQKAAPAPGPCTLTVVQFSEKPEAPVCRLVADGVPIGQARPLTARTYRPDGSTPLYDAVGRTILAMDRLAPAPDRVLVVVLTDGLENASREFTQRQVLDLIRERQATGRWTFAYLGANHDAWAAGERIGIGRGNTADFSAHEVGAAFDRLSRSTARYRMSHARMDPDFWRDSSGDDAHGTPAAPPSPPTCTPAPDPRAGRRHRMTRTPERPDTH